MRNAPSQLNRLNVLQCLFDAGLERLRCVDFEKFGPQICVIVPDRLIQTVMLDRFAAARTAIRSSKAPLDFFISIVERASDTLDSGSAKIHCLEQEILSALTRIRRYDNDGPADGDILRNDRVHDGIRDPHILALFQFRRVINPWIGSRVARRHTRGERTYIVDIDIMPPQT